MTLRRLLAEAQRRGLIEDDSADDDRWVRLVERVVSDVRTSLFPAQLGLLDEERTWSVAFTSRQAGKNFTAVRLLVVTALVRPAANVIYLNQTFAEARRIMWADELDGVPAVLRSLGLERGVDYRLNESRLEVSFSNGSTVTLLGADRGGWEKLRGSKLDLLVVDEMQKAEDDGLRNALDQVLPPCFVARRGRFVGIGTPDEFCVGVFHDACTRAAYPQFAVHSWSAEDNDRRPDIWAGLLAWRAEAGLDDDDPRWLREGRGRWVREDQRLMLPLHDCSLWDGAYPDLIPSVDGRLVPRACEIEHYAGLDFGWTDSAALVVGSRSREEGVLREVHSWKQSGLDTDALAAVVKAAVARYGIKRIYADAADPKSIADLSRKWRLPVVGAEKHNKATWIQDMRAKARSGRFRVLRDSPLHGELRVLVPDPTQLRRKRLEAPPGSEDHCWDAARYLYRGVFTEFPHAPEAPMGEAELAARRAVELRALSLGGAGDRKRTGGLRSGIR